jgi:phosphocarrier protein
LRRFAYFHLEAAMVSENIVMQNRLGMHARPATLFVQTASKFSSEVTVARDGVSVNGKSIMGMLLLAAECGSSLTVAASGADEKEALKALKELFERKFDED